MTAPLWIASPPEVHSAALSSGPGSPTLLSAALAWRALGAEYVAVADELSATLAAVQTGGWQGPTAESYVAAHLPYLAWLGQAAAAAGATATGHETAAAAYVAALAAMPTLAELAANHAVHAVLVATNFFGINLIPIAVNEADYLRMWVQAAATMTAYHAASSTAVAASPQVSPAPRIVKAATPGKSQDDDGGPTKLSWWETRIGDVAQAIGTDLSGFPTDPAGAITHLLTDPVLITEVPHWAGEVALTFAPQITDLTEAMFALVPPIGILPGFSGVAGLAGLAQLADVQAPASAPVTPAPVPAGAPEVPVTQPVAAAAPPPGAAPLPASAPGTPVTAPGFAGAAPPPGAPPGGFLPYLVGATPDPEPGVRMRARAREQAPVPAGVAEAAERSATGSRRPTRQRRPGVIDRGYRFEYLAAPDEPDPPVPDTAAWASDHGAGRFGFAGTLGDTASITASGLAHLDGSAGLPMMPGTWPGGEPTEPDQ
ncbi:hypothetical protein AWC30_05470 [Mycolicibacillus trivialis]|uniref:PPE family domain-containing protein n=1 Tax=Mycolicibacillus trivialis TaxID=1798 RepID=A0A1X2EP81_9MYCO|nr:PPE family protein [Mycolicibacillus trivialis]ORX07011.1 hypothetical protein AWC30_05470 [Mycolicibacillus trivialis]